MSHLLPESKSANKPLVHNTYRCHASCGARCAPSAGVAHL